MGVDSFTEVTTQSWGSRLKQSFGGIIFGLILVAGSTFLLFWNEGRAVKRAKALEEGAASVISVSSSEVDPGNQAKLIHTSGTVETSDQLVDSDFEITATGIKLKRSSEMYQWREQKHTKTEEKVGGKKKTTTTYSYEKSWSSSLINSDDFKKREGHRNPASLAYSDREWQATNVSLGAFSLNPSQISSVGHFQSMALPDSILEQIPQSLRGRTQIEGQNLYVGADPSTPQIGDLRISFSYAPPGETISIVAQQDGQSFIPYVAQSGGTIQLLEQGSQTADQMFAAAKRSNTIMTWLIRVGGFFLMFIGFRTIMNPIRTLAAIIPFLARVVGFGLGLVSFLLAATLSLLTIAIAWFVYRPLLSAVLVGVIIAIFVGVKMLKKPAVA